MINNIIIQTIIKSFIIFLTLTGLTYWFISYLNKTIVYNKWPQHAQYGIIATAVVFLIISAFTGVIIYNHEKNN